MSGFYSKDLIIEFFFMSNINFFVLFLVIICILSTFIYSVRLFYLINLSREMSLHFFMSADLLGIYLPMSLLFLFSFSGGALIV